MDEFFFYFKQKTAYEMRISDWSSDVCSSDLKGRYASSILQHPRILRPAALARIDHQRTLAHRDARQPARRDLDPLRRHQHEGAQVDVARREPSLGKDRHGRERQRRLRDILARVRFQLGTESRDLLLARPGAATHPISTRSVDLLHHQLDRKSTRLNSSHSCASPIPPS